MSCMASLTTFPQSSTEPSARELARRCRDTNAFQWIAGGLEPSYHTLSTFRVQHLDLLDDLLTDSIALLPHIIHGVSQTVDQPQ